MSKSEGGIAPVSPVCCRCGKPVRRGEPHWAGDHQNRAWHYSCAERAGLTLSWLQLRQRPAAISPVAIPVAPERERQEA